MKATFHEMIRDFKAIAESGGDYVCYQPKDGTDKLTPYCLHLLFKRLHYFFKTYIACFPAFET